MIWLEQVINAIQPCEPTGDKIITQIPSKTGIHLITSPFNVVQFKNNFADELRAYKMSYIDLEIHKDTPTNLFIV